MRRSSLMALCLLVSAAPVRAQIRGDALQFSAAGREVGAWLAVFNEGTADDMRRFLLNHAPSQFDILDRMIALRQRTGGFQPKKIVLAKDNRVTLLLQERASDQFAGITVDVEPWVPHRITRLSIGMLERPPEFAIRRLTDSQLADSLRARLEDPRAPEHFSGAVLLAKDGRDLFTRAIGWADRERRVANTVDTRFRLGSMARMFTAVAVAQLVQAGKVRLDARLITYLPDYPNPGVASSITIHQLLTNTAGTGDVPAAELDAQRDELRTIGDYVKAFGARELQFEPGSRWANSNFGYVLLGAVIERVSGRSYHEYLAEHVLAPANMHATGFDAEGDSIGDVAIGYTRVRDTAPWTPSARSLPWRGTSASGGYSTVRDLSRFASALSSGALLDSAHTALVTSGKVDARGGRYAYGFYDIASPAGRRVGLGGAAQGMNGDLEIFPAEGYVVVVLANLDPPAARTMSDYILSRLPLSR